MTTTAPQLELDFQIGHALPWLRVSEIAEALNVSEDHVCNLFDAAALDFVIDVRAQGSARPYYRVLRESWLRYRWSQEAPDYEAVVARYLRQLPAVMGSQHVANFLRVSENHVLALGRHFLDAGAATQTFFRASKLQLMAFIHARKL